MNQPTSPLHERAADNLRYIRETMERAAEFTAVPGYGGMAMGASAVAFGVLAGMQTDPQRWLRVWLADLAIGVAIAAVAMTLKAKRSRAPLFSGPGRKFLLAFAPPVAAGGVLTVALGLAHQFALLPPTWLLLYGAGVTAGGSASIRLIPIMGVTFFTLGVMAVAVPEWGNLMMILGFGVAQIVFGALIARRHGG
ncbi:MAG TPA: hypothetical protein VM100_00695 [Longimicrobiales bacterium]|nr:hypothetical protein [Longimicrobiales bacterium]